MFADDKKLYISFSNALDSLETSLQSERDTLASRVGRAEAKIFIENQGIILPLLHKMLNYYFL